MAGCFGRLQRTPGAVAERQLDRIGYNGAIKCGRAEGTEGDAVGAILLLNRFFVTLRVELIALSIITARI